jgi:cell wall-associated NlpC family hydrolase
VTPDEPLELVTQQGGESPAAENNGTGALSDPDDTGPRVMRLKERLMELGYMQRDVITAVYDPYTQLGVMFFQRGNDLPVTGIADARTMELALSGDAAPYCIVQGTEGEDVRQLQSGLAGLGFPVDVSGIYDEATGAAVRDYQAAHGAQATGVVDALLRKVIMDEAALRGVFTGGTSATNPGVEAMIAMAEQQMGKVYVLGGKGPDTFDCSGLIYYCLNQSGYQIGYMTSGEWVDSQFETVQTMGALRRGDIVCFGGHVGIYLGDGLMLDASSSVGRVRIADDIRKTAYWNDAFICGKRIWS